MDTRLREEIIFKAKEAELLGKQGRYGEAIVTLQRFANDKKGEATFDFWGDLACFFAGADCTDCCKEAGVGGCCAAVILLILLGWGCSCACPDDCSCCGTCSDEFYDTCICDFGSGLFDVCCSTCC